MAPTSLNLDSYSDLEVRDVAHRHQFQTAPSANIIQHLYRHVSVGNSSLLISYAA